MRYKVTVETDSESELVSIVNRLTANASDGSMTTIPTPVVVSPAPVETVTDVRIGDQPIPVPTSEQPMQAVEQPAPVVTQPAPVVTPAPTPAAEPGNPPAVDTNGIPWDKRIHAKSKVLKADGSWRMRRGVTDETVKAVEAELRANQQTTVAVPTTEQPTPQPAAPVAVPTTEQPAGLHGVQPGSVPEFLARNADGSFVQPPTTLAPPAGQPQVVNPETGNIAVPNNEQPVTPPAPAPVVTQSITFEQIVAMISDALQQGRLANEQMPAFWQSIGVTGVQDLAGNQAAINQAFAKLTGQA